VVTFYGLFNLEPQGRNTICVCRGTACHTRGSRDLLERLMLNLGFQNLDEEAADKISLNTSDGRFTLRTVACFGQCALAPVVEVNHQVYGHMNEQTLQRELEHLERETAKK
jgi:NADH-quinone oxidoreductase subunit E